MYLYEIFLKIFNQINELVYFSIAIFFIVAIFRNKKIKGAFGEFIVNYIILKKFNKNKYRLIKNVTLKTKD